MRQLLIGLILLCLGPPLQAALHLDRDAYQWDGRHFRVPLELRDLAGVERQGWPVTTGVPLPYGLVQDVASLRLLDEQGREIPCQFEATSRYWARDGSIRWVLLDFQLDLPAGGKRRLWLSNDQPAAPVAKPIRIRETADAIEVDTGVLRVRVPRHGGPLLQRVEYRGRPVIEADADDGPWLQSAAVEKFRHYRGDSWNTHGWSKTVSVERHPLAEARYGAGRSHELRIETRGPLRTTLLIRGRYLPAETGPGRVAEGLYDYSTRLHFYRASPLVVVEHAIENADPTPPLWQYPFRWAELDHRLALDGRLQVTAGGEGAADGLPSVATLAADTPLGLVQAAGQPGKVRGKVAARPGGYRFGPLQTGKVGRPRAAGGKARFLAVSDGRSGVGITLRYWWQEAPRAVYLDRGRLRIRLHDLQPEDRPYDLDFGERSLHDLLYFFFDGPADAEGAAALASAFEQPLLARPPPAWIADTESWYFEMDPDPKAVKGRRSGRWQPIRIGYRGHGFAQGYNSGGHHESLNSAWLPFMLHGGARDYQRLLATSRWHIAHNPGWAYRGNRLHFGTGEDRYPALDAQLEAWNRLTLFGPKDFYLWGGQGPTKQNQDIAAGTSYLNRYKWLPDIEHYALFQLFEYYYLSGDRRALDAIHGFVDWDLTFQHQSIFQGRLRPLSDTGLFERDPEALRRRHYARIYTWMLYTNLAGFQATGSPVMDEFARWQLRRMLALLRHRHGQLTRWSVKPGTLLGLLPDRLANKLSDHIDSPLLRSEEAVHGSHAKTWMEAQGVLALHEAYRTYGDERILDGLWAQADYFSHHVLYYPRLTMLNQYTSMPNALLGVGEKALSPQRHDRHIQMWPLLYHYTGWPEVRQRYQAFAAKRRGRRLWFTQTTEWQQGSVAKGSTRPPDAVTDLRVLAASRDGVRLAWTAPADDGPGGRAARYFVKISDRPIVARAPTDNPARAADKARILTQAEDWVLARHKPGRPLKSNYLIPPGATDAEPRDRPRVDPDWHRVNAFWMAEHVAGEPEPAAAGTPEAFTLRELHLHAWFGAPREATLRDLKPGTYYVALCSWDADRNLSPLSNVVEFTLR
ncbi:hypothetical protein QVG61_07875 [Thiohalobacter sp. IOR34]|uniref:hypothetical protein n=1 Tax=Thiohalobacter sp. IOR34 TaxID=3057176 RepID=UPI0025AF8057|nr:hypothetical protein [Thiohalobacter sp. IOR34]WJW74435.1 hypothetical protein QVG61_07875 [Thiohalobacter sp. IOR34]